MTDAEDSSSRSPFERFSTADALDLIDEYPLAWVVPRSGAAQPSLLPLLAERGATGELVSLLGHMGRRNVLVHAFEADARATILFTGPQAPLSTALVSDPQWAPSWAYAQLSISARLRFVPNETGDAVQRLTGKIEGCAGTAWTPEMVGARYKKMIGSIVAFRLVLEEINGRFKLGQDEPVERLSEIVKGLDDLDLVRWISRFNESRR